MAIQNTLVGNPSATNIFTASTGTDYAVTTMIFTNTADGDDATLDLWVVPYGGVPGSDLHRVLKAVPIPRTETFIMDSEKLILASGDAIWAQVAPGAVDQKINALVSSVVIS